VALAILLGLFLTGRNTSSSRDPPGTSEEVVPLAYWPGKPHRRWKTDTVVMQTGAGRLTRATARMLCDPHVQLLAPLVFYTGVSLGFVLNDFTVVSVLRSLPVGVGRIFESVCLTVGLFVCLSDCLQHNSKTNDPKVFKLGIANDLEMP